MIEDGIKISELNTTISPSNEDLIPIVQDGETKSITYGDFLGNIKDIGDWEFYNIATTLKTHQTASAWHNCFDDYTTNNLPAGRYIIICHLTFSSDNANVSILTIKPIVDASEWARRVTIPVTSLTQTACLVLTADFQTSGTHTINFQAYGQNAWNCLSVYIQFVRIK